MIINKISGLKEISNGRNAALLINLKTYEATVNTTFIFIANFIACVKQHQDEDNDNKDKINVWSEKNIQNGYDENKSSIEDIEVNDDINLTDFILDGNNIIDNTNLPGTDNEKIDWGTADVFVKETKFGKKVVIYSQTLNYKFRGKDLYQLSPLEYGCIIEVIEDKDEEKQDENIKCSGKQKNTSPKNPWKISVSRYWDEDTSKDSALLTHVSNEHD